MKLLTLIATALIGLKAHAFTLTISPDMEGFKKETVSFHYNPTNCPSALKGEIKEAMKLWDSVPNSSLKLKLAGETSTTVASFRLLGFSETAIIGCSNDFGTDSADSNGNNGCTGACLESVLGVGIGAIPNGSKNLTKGYLILNVNSGVGGNVSNKTSTQRKIVLAHEMGHVLGLGHSEEVAALMHYSISKKKNLNLHQDDIDGISYLYPRDELSGDEMMGCGLVKTTNNSGPTNPLAILILGLPLLAMAAARRLLAQQRINA